MPPLGNINIGDSYYVTSDEWVWDENHEYQYQPTVPRPEYIWTLPALSGEPQFDAWIYYGYKNNQRPSAPASLTLYMHGSNDMTVRVNGILHFIICKA